LTAVVVIAATVLAVFIAGGITGAVLLVSLASRREDRRTLSYRAPNRIALAGRFVTGLKVSDPDSLRGQIGYQVDGDQDYGDQDYGDAGYGYDVDGDAGYGDADLSDQAYQGQTPDSL
jgi:hypothetical protein